MLNRRRVMERDQTRREFAMLNPSPELEGQRRGQRKRGYHNVELNLKDNREGPDEAGVRNVEPLE